MWERFTQRTKLVVTAAREEALRLNSEYVRTEHILLGLCQEPEGIAAKVLGHLGVDIEALALEIEQQCQRGVSTVSSGEITFTPRAEKVVELAVEEARRFNQNYIGTEHILLGLIKEGEGIAAKILRDIKVDLARVQLEIIRLLGDQPEVETPAETSPRGHSPSQNVTAILEKSFNDLIAELRGAAAPYREELSISVGQYFQRLRSQKYFDAFMMEWLDLVEKGHVSDKSLNEQGQQCLQELLSFLDHALPDEARFRMLKAIFLSGFTGDGRFSSRILPEQFMFICKKLSPGEAVTLCAAYKISEGFGSEEGSKGVPVWPERVAEISGLHSRSLVEFYEEGLIEKHLVVPRKLSDDAGKARRRWFRRTDPQTVSERHQSAFGKCGRLTDLGYSLCEHIYKYDDPLDAKERDSGFDS